MKLLTGIPERKLLPPANPAYEQTVEIREYWTRDSYAVYIGGKLVHWAGEPPFVIFKSSSSLPWEK
jgi:hypothetical protein